MSLTSDEISYIAKHRLVKLTDEGDHSLYLSTVHGAVTVQRAMELDRVHAEYRAALRNKRPDDRRLWDDVVSNDLSILT